jgi:hypothetical protein
LREKAALFNEGKQYTFSYENRITKGTFSGTLEFQNGVPFVNGRQIL